MGVKSLQIGGTVLSGSFKNVLGETLSSGFVSAVGLRNAKKGWRTKPFMFFGKRRVGTHSNSRLSSCDLEAGWHGGLSNSEAKEGYSRHGQGGVGNHSDNHTGGACLG